MSTLYTGLPVFLNVTRRYATVVEPCTATCRVLVREKHSKEVRAVRPEAVRPVSLAEYSRSGKPQCLQFQA